MNIRIIEVGPRDGLQNESIQIPTTDKLAFIRALQSAGLMEIEATSFVSPKWVPQLADSKELWPLLPPGKFSALVPNLHGLDTALSLGVERIAVFTAASEAFTKRNINMTIEESINVFSQMIPKFRAAPGEPAKKHVRAYVSTAFECPYAGRISVSDVVTVCEQLVKLGVDELAIGDTIGTAAPPEVRNVAKALKGLVPWDQLAFHFHDTRGTAVANIATMLDLGGVAFDSSAGGLGGCPYAPGAGGNLATEDLVYLLERWGIRTGVDQPKLATASLPVLKVFGRAPSAKAQLAGLSLLPADE